MTLLSARRSHVEALSTYVAAAILASHGASGAGGFSSRDVRFFFLLFTNFVEHDLTRPGQDLALSQVSRVLLRLHRRRWLTKKPAREKTRGRPGPRFALTDIGLVGLVHDLVEEGARRAFDEALFVAVFTASYRAPILAQIGPLYRTKVGRLLDARRVLERAAARIARIEADLTARAREGLDLAAEAKRLFARGASLGRLDRPGAYQLHAVKPLGELLEAMPADLRAFEIERGIELRAKTLFDPLARRARAELALLRELASSHQD